jgi:superfamily II DNA or RNA helicase
MAGNPTERCKNGDLDVREPLPSLPPPGIEPGCEVVARGCTWRVEASAIHADCCELHLRGGTGDRRVLLWPFDRPSPAAVRPRLRVMSLRAWARDAGAAMSRDVDPRAPRARFTGEVLAYQLAPAVAMAEGTPRVLLADEVGLGKTIQAGWILADLLAREPGSRALVAVPAGLRDQWASELVTFFSVSPARVDAAWLRAAIADRPADVSPWAAPGAYLASIDFLKRADVAATLSGVLWDLLIADEAHTAAAPTDRHGVLAAVASASRRVVIVSATPYSGDTAAFESLASLGACDGEPPPLIFRRSREDVGDPRRRRHRFVTVRIDGAEFRLQRLLERYTSAVWREAAAGADGARLAMTILRKRALSSPAALLRSLVRRQDLLRGAAPAPVQLPLFDDPPEADDALPDIALAAPGLADRRREDRWLDSLVAAALDVSAVDSKARFLLRLLARLADEAVVVFTEYRDTLHHLSTLLPGALQLHGALTGSERTAVQRRFNDGGGILLATDAAAEGLNLQRRCRLLVNFELPWNPARLEQRIGRIDRIGQRRTVHAISLVARDTAEDLVVAGLARRLARVAATLGDRDRLASFLTDARVARSVIGGKPLEPQDAAPAVALRRAAALDEPCARIAASLTRSGGQADPLDIRIARSRGGGVLRPGVIALVRTAARTPCGMVAERILAVSTGETASPRPRTHAEARARARDVIDHVEMAAPRMPEVCEWAAGIREMHRTATAAGLAREELLRRDRRAAIERQPGLFDRRAEREVDTRREAEDERMREHERRLRLLAASMDVRIECTVAAVLIVSR